MSAKRALLAVLAAGLITAPTASAGERIVYGTFGGNIGAIRPDGSGQQDVVSSNAGNPHVAVSPDGMRVAFECDPEYDPSEYLRQICVSDWDGQHRTKLTTTPGRSENPAWSADGARIAFSSTRDGDREIFVMDADGSGEQQLTSNAVDDDDPDFSPDGSRIVFSSTRDGDAEIYSMSASGTDVTRVTDSAGRDGEPAWSPDGTQIAFVREQPEADGPSLYRMGADGSSPVLLREGNADYVTHAGSPDWSPDGTRIATNCGNDICTLDAQDGGDITEVTQSDGQYANFANPAWTARLGPQPAITVGDAGSVTETTSDGYRQLNFDVSLSRTSDDPVEVDYDTVDGTAKAPGDYAPAQGTLTFAPGQTSQTVSVQVEDDSDEERDETLGLRLTAPRQATIADGEASGTIVDDDGTVPTAGFSYDDAGAFDIAFDGRESSDPDGPIVAYEWDFGDGSTGTGPTPQHEYPSAGTYTVVLTVRDAVGKSASYQDYVPVTTATVGIGTTGPEERVAVDERLRCIVGTDSVFARRGSACATAVAYGGQLYAPRGAIPGAVEGEDYIAFEPVEQTSTGDAYYAPSTVTTKVALGNTGVQVEQTDSPADDGRWYRTEVKLSGNSLPATIYRAGDCFSAGSDTGYGYEDAGTRTAGCAPAAHGNEPSAAFLPLSNGAHYQAGDEDDVFGRVLGRSEPADICNCDDPSIDHAAAIAWQVPAGDGSSRGSLTAYPSDGRLPLLEYADPDFAQAEPGAENGFTIAVRNPNSEPAPVTGFEAVLSRGMTYRPGTTTGVTTQDPVVDCAGCAQLWYGEWTAPAHDAATLHFGVTHNSSPGTDTADTSAGTDEGWILVRARALASVTVAPAPPGPPDTVITDGPDGPTADNTPTFRFSANKSGSTFQCSIDSGTPVDCSSPHTLRALRDGTHTFEVQAVKNGVADPTPASRRFSVDTVAPSTSIVSAPAHLSRDRDPVFEVASDEAGATFECRVTPAGGSASFGRCPARYRPGPLADGKYVFQARAVDAAGNADPNPVSHEWEIDATPPDTSVERAGGGAGDDGSRDADQLEPVLSPASGGAQMPIVGDGVTSVQVACPASSPNPCEGTVVLSANDAQIARADFEVPPGNTEQVPVELPNTVSNRVERTGSLPVEVGLGPRTDEQHLVLVPDPRTPRVLDAGVRVPVDDDQAGMRLACPKARKQGCAGKLRLEELPELLRAAGGKAETPRAFGRAAFKVRGGRGGRPRIHLSRAARALLRRRGSLHVSVAVTTRQRGAKAVRKTLDLTLTSKRRKP